MFTLLLLGSNVYCYSRIVLFVLLSTLTTYRAILIDARRPNSADGSLPIQLSHSLHPVQSALKFPPSLHQLDNNANAGSWGPPRPDVSEQAQVPPTWTQPDVSQVTPPFNCAFTQGNLPI